MGLGRSLFMALKNESDEFGRSLFVALKNGSDELGRSLFVAQSVRGAVRSWRRRLRPADEKHLQQRASF